jgi:hypothetical protein
MNRLHHVKATLPFNLDCCKTLPDSEFVILDYNSTDGLFDWINVNQQHFGGKVKYYRTTEPQFYKRSHSRNMAMKLASGDIVCNLDADNFVGIGFATYIQEQFLTKKNIYLSPSEELQSDIFGKLCFTKSDFLAIGGYDEKIELYGFEDFDLKNRLELLGLEKVTFNNPDFAQAIVHSELERIENEFLYKNLNKVLIEVINPFTSRLFFCLEDLTYESVVIEDSQYTHIGGGFVRPLDQRKRYNMLTGTEKKGFVEDLEMGNYKEITDQKVKIDTIHFYSQIKNKKHTEIKLKSPELVANQEIGFGKGTVYQGFENKIPITIE